MSCIMGRIHALESDVFKSNTISTSVEKYLVSFTVSIYTRIIPPPPFFSFFFLELVTVCRVYCIAWNNVVIINITLKIYNNFISELVSRCIFPLQNHLILKNIYISACVFLKIISYLISQRYPWLCLTLCGHLAFFPCSFTNLFMFALSLQIDCKPFEDNHIYYLVLFLSFPSIVLIPSS